MPDSACLRANAPCSAGYLLVFMDSCSFPHNFTIPIIHIIDGPVYGEQVSRDSVGVAINGLVKAKTWPTMPATCLLNIYTEMHQIYALFIPINTELIHQS